eukprot:5912162-Heterocapsa_arctica.AAC.1
MEEDRKVWTKQEIAPANFIEELECQMRTETKSDTEWEERNTGIGAWRICGNPICYRCDIIDKAEMETVIPKEKKDQPSCTLAG